MTGEKVDKRKILSQERLEILKVARSKLNEKRRRTRAIKDITDSKDFLIMLRSLIDEHIKKAEEAVVRSEEACKSDSDQST